MSASALSMTACLVLVVGRDIDCLYYNPGWQIVKLKFPSTARGVVSLTLKACNGDSRMVRHSFSFLFAMLTDIPHQVNLLACAQNERVQLNWRRHTARHWQADSSARTVFVTVEGRVLKVIYAYTCAVCSSVQQCTVIECVSE